MPITSPRASVRVRPGVPLDFPDLKLRRLAEIVRGLLDGKIYATGTVTLTASAATTTLSDRRIGRESKIFLTPTTANAAAALATTYQTFPNADDGAAVINHANNAQADKTFGFAILG